MLYEFGEFSCNLRKDDVFLVWERKSLDFFFLPTKGFCADLIAYCGMTTKRGEGKDQSKRAVTGPKAMAFECL